MFEIQEEIENWHRKHAYGLTNRQKRELSHDKNIDL